MNVGIVCEGRTDFILLEQVVLAVFGPSDIRPLQPVRDALDPTRWSEAGWTQVRRWCEARGAGGITDELEMGGLDVIVLQVDGDLCGQQGMPSTRAALCDHIKAAWIGPPGPPNAVVICIPALATDAWLVAALDPGVDGQTLERDPRPADRLTAWGLNKRQSDYRDHAHRVHDTLPRLLPHMSELDRFVGKLRASAPRADTATPAPAPRGPLPADDVGPPGASAARRL